MTMRDWEWVLYHEICLSPTPSTYSIIIQPIPWLRQMSIETYKWQSHNFESQLICSTHFPCNQFISDIKSLHFLTLAIPRFETLTLTSRDRCRGCKIGKGLKINRKGQRGDFPAFYVLQFCRNFSTILLLNVAHCELLISILRSGEISLVTDIRCWLSHIGAEMVIAVVKMMMTIIVIKMMMMMVGVR